MINFEEALIIAKKAKKDINKCAEYTTAYVFSSESDMFSFGGSGPVVILKDSGRAVNMPYYIDSEHSGEYVRDIDIN